MVQKSKVNFNFKRATTSKNRISSLIENSTRHFFVYENGKIWKPCTSSFACQSDALAVALNFGKHRYNSKLITY